MRVKILSALIRAIAALQKWLVRQWELACPETEVTDTCIEEPETMEAANKPQTKNTSPQELDVTRSNRNIDDLHPTIARACRELIRRAAELGLPVLITETYRSGGRQEWLYAQGRTRPGLIVTNVRTLGKHSFRVAFDFCRNVRGREFDNSDGFFDRVGAIWREMGGVWGGDWTSFIDRPHCEFTAGQSIGWLRSGNTLPENSVMRWEKG